MLKAVWGLEWVHYLASPKRYTTFSFYLAPLSIHTLCSHLTQVGNKDGGVDDEAKADLATRMEGRFDGKLSHAG